MKGAWRVLHVRKWYGKFNHEICKDVKRLEKSQKACESLNAPAVGSWQRRYKKYTRILFYVFHFLPHHTSLEGRLERTPRYAQKLMPGNAFLFYGAHRFDAPRLCSNVHFTAGRLWSPRSTTRMPRTHLTWTWWKQLKPFCIKGENLPTSEYIILQELFSVWLLY